MSDRSDHQNLELARKRMLLLSYLCGRLGIALEDNYVISLDDVSDGEMGGFSINGRYTDPDSSPFLEARYIDKDACDVILTLFLDSKMLPTEVEFWKVTFDKLIEFPSPNEIFDIKILSNSY